MNLYIPEIGDEIRLLADWTFDLYNEDRNHSLMEFVKDPRERTWQYRNDKVLPATILAGEILKIDRIYVRKGKEDYSSITFLWKGKRIPSKTEIRPAVSYGNGSSTRAEYTMKIPARPIRFWAKLTDVNKIMFEPV